MKRSICCLYDLHGDCINTEDYYCPVCEIKYCCSCAEKVNYVCTCGEQLISIEDFGIYDEDF